MNFISNTVGIGIGSGPLNFFLSFNSICNGLKWVANHTCDTSEKQRAVINATKLIATAIVAFNGYDASASSNTRKLCANLVIFMIPIALMNNSRNYIRFAAGCVMAVAAYLYVHAEDVESTKLHHRLSVVSKIITYTAGILALKQAGDVVSLSLRGRQISWLESSLALLPLVFVYMYNRTHMDAEGSR